MLCAADWANCPPSGYNKSVRGQKKYILIFSGGVGIASVRLKSPRWISTPGGKLVFRAQIEHLEKAPGLDRYSDLATRLDEAGDASDADNTNNNPETIQQCIRLVLF
jgi:hypothetical protein